MGNTDKITREEMIELFGEEMPIEAAMLIWESPPDKTIGEVRADLRALANKTIIPRGLEITSVRDLRLAIADNPDDTEIYFQVVAADGIVWTMFGTIANIPGSKPNKKVITLKHPDLLTLPTDTS